MTIIVKKNIPAAIFLVNKRNEILNGDFRMEVSVQVMEKNYVFINY